MARTIASPCHRTAESSASSTKPHSIAHDASGRGNHGSVRGDAKWTKGVLGGALSFDGRDDFVAIPNESQFDLMGPITVTAWIRVESFTKPWQSIVTKGDRAWRLHRASATKSAGWACSDLSRQQVGNLFGKTEVTDGQWHYVEAKWRSDGSVLLRLDHGLRKVRGVDLRLNRT